MEDGGFRGRGGGSRGRGGRGRGGGGRGGISWIKKEEPKFIRQFKERIAYKEQASIETKKRVVDDKDLNIEKEEDLPQVVQLNSGDLDATEYVKMKNKEEVENAASSFGKILFKRPKKASDPVEEFEESKKSSELSTIFNLDENGEEKSKDEIENEPQDNKEDTAPKKKLLDDEEDKTVQYGLQQPPTKKRFIDGPTSKTTSISAAKVLAREAKSGNKKLLSFYDEEEEEIDEYCREDFKEKMEKEAERKAEESD